MKGRRLSLFILLAVVIDSLYFAGRVQIIPSKQAELIYGIVTQYKYIRRVSFLFCHGMGSRLDQNQTFLRPLRTTIDTVTTSESLPTTGGILIKLIRIGTVTKKEIGIRLERILKCEDHRQVVVLDLSCGNNSLKILKLASDKGLFNSSYHWLLIEKDYGVNLTKSNEDNRLSSNGNGTHNAANLFQYIATLNINMNTELMLARTIDQDQDYTLFDVWNSGRQYGGKLNINEVGRFSLVNGLQMFDWFRRATVIVRRMDMKNALIRCMIVITNRMSDNFVHYLNHEHNPHLDSMNRFHFGLLSHVRDMFNFSFRLYRTNSWGYLKNGTYDGMIGSLIRHEVDIAGSPIFFRIERAQVIDYTARTWIASLSIFNIHGDTGW